jgi:hypothetical protein
MWAGQGGLPAVSANPAGSAARPRRTAAASAPASGATRSASSSSGARVGVNSTHGHDAASGAAASPSWRIRGSTPARSSDDFPAPDAPDTTSSPAPASSRDIRSSISAVAASRPKNHPASCSPNTASPRYGEPATVCCPALSTAASTCAAGTVPRAAATNTSAVGPVRPSAPASSTAVSLCAVRLMLRSRLLTDRTDTRPPPPVPPGSASPRSAAAAAARQKKEQAARSPSQAPHTTCPPRLPAPGGISPGPTVRRGGHPRHVLPPHISLRLQFRGTATRPYRSPRPMVPGTVRQGPRRRCAAITGTPGVADSCEPSCGLSCGRLCLVTASAAVQRGTSHLDTRQAVGKPGQATKETTMSRNLSAPDQQRPGDLPVPGTAAMASPAPGSADPIHRRQLEKSVSWSGRERLQCLCTGSA